MQPSFDTRQYLRVRPNHVLLFPPGKPKRAPSTYLGVLAAFWNLACINFSHELNPGYLCWSKIQTRTFVHEALRGYMRVLGNAFL